MTRNNSISVLRVLILSLILSTAIGYSFAAWVAPSAPPPNGNPPPPINVGSSPQVKDGNLYLNNWLIAKKAMTVDSTVATDGPKTLTTKDYVDSKIPTTAAVTFYTKTCTFSGSVSWTYCTATCNAADHVTGGGVNVSPAVGYPNGDNAYTCGGITTGTGTCSARCAHVN